MPKKFGPLATAIAVLAFAVPALASASTGVKQGGSLLSPGTVLEGVSTNTTMTTTLGTLKCASVSVSAELSKNNAAEGFEAVGNGETSTSTCVLGSTSFTVKNIILNKLTSGPSESGKGKVIFSFEMLLSSSLTCKYATTGASFTYPVEGSNLRLTNVPLTATPAACGEAKLSGLFSQTAGGSAVAIM